MSDHVLSALAREPDRHRKLRSAGRLATWFALAAAIVILLSTRQLQTAYEADRVAAEAADRAQIFRAALLLEIGKAEPLPAILSTDPALVDALDGGDAMAAAARLDDLREMTGVDGFYLLDGAGWPVVASTAERQPFGADGRAPVLSGAVSGRPRAFFGGSEAGDGVEIYFTHPVGAGADVAWPKGAIVARIRLEALTRSWARSEGQIVVSNARDVVVSSTVPGWRNRMLTPLMEAAEREGAETLPGVRILPPDWANDAPAVEIDGSEYIRAVVPVGALGLRLHYLAPMRLVDDRVRSVLALEVMGMALLAALYLYLTSRRTQRAYLVLQQESDALRDLNQRLQSEIEERRRVERELREAREGLEQASKLAALGQMSAAVSHELSQPLAAMKTYLAGARLLVERDRSAEAVGSLERVDGLIERMGSLTRQLKAFARKSGEELDIVDLRDVARGALSVMSPQIREAGAELSVELADGAVRVRGDQLRLEQILVNLLRNALDATREAEVKTVALTIGVRAKTACATVCDSGPGLPAEISGQLFEPFFTTKKPGEGLGLGLAISAGIASDMGGSLSAASNPEGGACFELSLPLVSARGARA